MENNTKQQNFLEDFVSVIMISAILFCLVSLFGRLILRCLDMPLHSFLYNFVFGMGVIASATLVVAVVEELRR